MKPSSELTKTNFWTIAINSTAAYVLSFLIVFYVNHFIKIILAGSYSYDVGFDWVRLLYYIEPFEWTHDSVRLIFSAGPILVVVIGTISLIAFWSLVEEHARLKTFFMWLTLHSYNFFFGGLLIGNVFKKGVGHVFNWMYLTDTSKMIVALIGFLGLLGTAYIMARPVAISSNSYFSKLNEKNSPFFITAQIIVPFIFGTIIYLLFFAPNILFQEGYSWISLAVLLIFIAARVNKMETVYFDEEERFIEVSRVILVTTILFVFGIRILLRNEIFIGW
jgi:hypothetical protein